MILNSRLTRLIIKYVLNRIRIRIGLVVIQGPWLLYINFLQGYVFNFFFLQMYK